VEFKPSVREHFQPRLQSRDRSTHGGETEQTNLPLWWRAGIWSIVLFFSFTQILFFPFTQILSHKSKIPGMCTRTQNHRLRVEGTQQLDKVFFFFDTNSFTQINPRSVYSDTDGKLLLRVEGTQQLDKVVVSSQKIDCTTTYECEVCHKFQGDSKAMRQHMAGHDLQSADDWFARWQVLKPEFPCLLCRIRNSHCVNPGKDPNTMDGWFMWFETKNSQSTHYCKLVQEMKPYGSWASANKCRWKSANWKDSKPPEPSSNVAAGPYGVLSVKRCFGNGICTNTFPKATVTPISWWPLLFSQVSQSTHMKEIMSRVSSRIRGLTSKCPKNDKNPHNCDCAL